MHAIHRKRALIIIGGIWALSALVATPTFVEYSIHSELMTSQYVDNTTAVTSHILCKPMSDVFDKMNGFFILCASYMIPQTLIFSSFYCLITSIVRQGQQTTGGLTSSFVSHNRTRIIKMLIIIAVLFSFAWLSYFVLFVGAVSSCFKCYFLLFIIYIYIYIYIYILKRVITKWKKLKTLNAENYY